MNILKTIQLSTSVSEFFGMQMISQLKQKKRTKAQSSKQPLSDSVALTYHPEVVTHSTDLLLG